MKHHTKHKGDIAVLKTIIDLSEKGYAVFRPAISEHYHYDILAVDETNLKYFRIQCKYRKNGEAPDSTSWTNKSGCKTRNYKLSDFDYFAIYLPDIDKIIYPSIKFKGCNFRFTVPDSATPFYWYEDFLNFTDTAKKKTYKDFGYELSKTERRSTSPRFKNRKVERPTKEELYKLLWKKPSTQIAKDFGVSSKAVEKWAKSYGLEKPPRGYWMKNKWAE